MNWLRQLCAKICRHLAKGDARLQTRRADELPDVIDKGSIYLIGERGNLWFGALLCPCGCGDTIQLNFLEDASPRWTVKEHWNGMVTLQPSVWRQKGCGAHFFVRAGKVLWCCTVDRSTRREFKRSQGLFDSSTNPRQKGTNK